MNGYTGVCRKCDQRRRLRKNGTVGGHFQPRPPTEVIGDARPCPGAGQLPRGGSEICSQCRALVGKGRAHKMDCSNPKQIGGKDTR